LTPGAVAVAVKRGLLPDGLDNLDTQSYAQAKLGAIHCAPKRARAMIREGALNAIGKLKDQPLSFTYPHMEPPYVRTAAFRKDGDTAAHEVRAEHPDSIIALMNLT